MSLTDNRGCMVSTDNRAALARYETALTLLNGFFADPLAEIEAALAEDPEFVMGHCFRAALFLISTEKAAEPELARSVERAEALGRRANDRERGHIAAARAWLAGDLRRSVELYGRVAMDHPYDLLAIQIAHQGDFFLGQSAMLRDRIARALPTWSEQVPGYGYLLGMYAFGLEETGDYARAEESGRRAVGIQPRDPWAIHAVAHVMEMQGRLDDGVRWLAERTEDWSRDNMFAFHNWWHLALYHLDRGETARVLQLYDEAIRPKPSPVQLESVDATAMLWRLHLRGLDVGARWAELADRWEPSVGDGYYAFNDVHAMLAFTAAGRGEPAARLLTRLERRAAEPGTNGTMTREVGLPVARAIRAFGQSRYADCAALLEAVRPVAHRFGGSHAQRDLISLTQLEAAMRAGDMAMARAISAERLALKPASPFNRLQAMRATDLPRAA